QQPGTLQAVQRHHELAASHRNGLEREEKYSRSCCLHPIELSGGDRHESASAAESTSYGSRAGYEIHLFALPELHTERRLSAVSDYRRPVFGSYAAALGS